MPLEKLWEGAEYCGRNPETHSYHSSWVRQHPSFLDLASCRQPREAELLPSEVSTPRHTSISAHDSNNCFLSCIAMEMVTPGKPSPCVKKHMKEGKFEVVKS